MKESFAGAVGMPCVDVRCNDREDIWWCGEQQRSDVIVP